VRLNVDWEAQPNAPNSEITLDDSVLTLRFWLNPWAYRAKQWQRGVLTFDNCRTWRLEPTNDEGWWRGQCRYGMTAPQWGAFYEVSGPDDLRHLPDDWVVPDGQGNGERHFLFYFRDETFGCLASDWSYEKGRE
jgi:hypothetical protein